MLLSNLQHLGPSEEHVTNSFGGSQPMVLPSQQIGSRPLHDTQLPLVEELLEEELEDEEVEEEELDDDELLVEEVDDPQIATD